MSTIHGSSISVTRKSEPGTRRRQSRALASAVGDLVGHSGSVTTTVDGSYNSTTQGYGGGLGPALMHRPPYMDVQTVKTNLTVDQAAKLEASLCVCWKRDKIVARVSVQSTASSTVSHTAVDTQHK